MNAVNVKDRLHVPFHLFGIPSGLFPHSSRSPPALRRRDGLLALANLLGEQNTLAGEADVHDFHATLLYLLGLEHEKLTFLHNGRRYRLTDVKGKVIHEVIG